MREYSTPRWSAPQLFIDAEATLAWSAHNEMSLGNGKLSMMVSPKKQDFVPSG
jgi:hypothetical protein